MPLDEHDLRHCGARWNSHTPRSVDPIRTRGSDVCLQNAQGHVIGEGATQRAGEAHAEVMALRAAQAAGADTNGGTAWVSLEPCSHHGRTPPCCDALDRGEIGARRRGGDRPQSAGSWRRHSEAARCRNPCRRRRGCVADAARELNIGFVSRMRRQRPWVRLKVASSLDGRTALPDGRSRWITGLEARADGHAWRRRAGAVVTGSGTALADDPRLDVRLVATECSRCACSSIRNCACPRHHGCSTRRDRRWSTALAPPPPSTRCASVASR